MPLGCVVDRVRSAKWLMSMNSTTSYNNAISAIAFILGVASVAFLMLSHHLFATSPVLIAAQVGAVLLMVWARKTFGRRSFHATASTSEGGLVADGPYRYLRHPIYASIIYFAWAGQVQSPTPASLAATVLLTLSLILRMLLEEHFLRAAYPEYVEYSNRAKRVIPFLF
jgi:protein-S-isoprenylcysteine O-methyltransferase Ste14